MNEWRGTKYIGYDDETHEEISKEVEYIPSRTEYELSKLINKVYKNRDDFYYYDNMIFIKTIGIAWGWTNLYFNDMADKLVIYDKYRTKESIFEDDTIGTNKIVFNSDGFYGVDYRDISFEDNFFYDISIGSSMNGYRFDTELVEKYPIEISEDVEKLEDELMLMAQNEINKNKIISNPNKGYILLLRGMICSNGDSTTDPFTSILKCTLELKKYEYDLKNRELILKDFFDDYRYRNVNYYGGSFNSCHELYSESYDCKYEYDDDFAHIYYDTINKKESGSMDDLKEVALSPIFEESSTYYYFNRYKQGGINYWESRGVYSDFEYAKYRMKEYNDETLNYAYNEIFARHGHDFKSKELKDYFSMFDWYKPIPGKVVEMSELNEYEQKNAKMIRDVINDRKR